MREEIKNHTLKEMRVLTDFSGPRFECRTKLMIAILKNFVERMQECPAALSSIKFFPIVFLINIYGQQTV